MKHILRELFNKNKKTVKITGKIISNPSYLTYVIRTKTGKMLVESPVSYKIADNVVVYDGVIQGLAGKQNLITSSLV